MSGGWIEGSRRRGPALACYFPAKPASGLVASEPNIQAISRDVQRLDHFRGGCYSNLPLQESTYCSKYDGDNTVYSTIVAVFTDSAGDGSDGGIWMCRWIDPSADYSAGLNGCENYAPPCLISESWVIAAQGKSRLCMPTVMCIFL